MGFTEGIPQVPLNLVLLKEISIRGFQLGSFVVRHPDRYAQAMRKVAAFAEAGMVPYVAAVHTLDDVVLAVQQVGERRATGKVVLDVSGQNRFSLVTRVPSPAASRSIA
ncbi:NADPH:quinone reductase-like Zn-dependent oxidoreductase [Arthrobacter sp. W4I7]|nr:NADPH:quinone reductase-like Zn-dependent oxidoreductase [Arthrobacter sp. W4I7]